MTDLIVPDGRTVPRSKSIPKVRAVALLRSDFASHGPEIIKPRLRSGR